MRRAADPSKLIRSAMRRSLYWRPGSSQKRNSGEAPPRSPKSRWKEFNKVSASVLHWTLRARNRTSSPSAKAKQSEWRSAYPRTMVGRPGSISFCSQARRRAPEMACSDSPRFPHRHSANPVPGCLVFSRARSAGSCPYPFRKKARASSPSRKAAVPRAKGFTGISSVAADRSHRK